MEWLKSLNDYAGLLALMALLAAIIVPFILYRLGQKDARRAAQDELDARDEASNFPYSVMDNKEEIVRQKFLHKQARK